MITKIFWFQFINSYASFFFLAFVAEWIGDCPDNGCIYSLSINLAIIFGIRLVSGNFFELLIPYLSYQYKFVRKYKSNSMFSRPEKEFMLEKVLLESARHKISN